MKSLSVGALIALVVGCHLDKLVGGSGGGSPPPSHGTAVGLAFMSQPQTAQAGSPIGPVKVSVVDSAGHPVAGVDTATVVVRLGDNPGGATLHGDTTAHPVNGVATFTNLWLDNAGNNYTLDASTGILSTKSKPFDITAPPPTTGDLTVTTSTTGSDLDPDGYTVTVDGNTSQPIATNSGSSGVTFSALPAGNHSVNLTGVASNCTVSGNNPRTLNVAAGTGASTAFSVACAAPPSGSIAVTVTTNGPNPPSGYTVTVDGGPGQSVGANGSVRFDGLSVASHSVGLSPIPSNCSVSGVNPQTVSVTANSATAASFTVTCTATTGDLVVTTTTGGSNLDPDGYMVSVAGNSQSIPTNGSVTFSNVPAGSQNVALSGVASNCTVNGANPVSASVPAGGIGHADFAINCVAPQNHAPVVTAGPDQNIVLSVFSMMLNGASFSDQDHDGPWTVRIDWGDGTHDTFTQGEGSITGSHTYPVSLLGATYQLTVTVTDAHGASNSASKTVTVTVA